MQVEQLHVPAIATRGAGSCRTTFNHNYPFGRSNNNRKSYASSSPTLYGNVRTHQKRHGTSRTPLEGDSGRDSLARANSSNGGKHNSDVTTVQARGHHQRSRHSTGTSCSESSGLGAQTDGGKVHHLQQGWAVQFITAASTTFKSFTSPEISHTLAVMLKGRPSPQDLGTTMAAARGEWKMGGDNKSGGSFESSFWCCDEFRLKVQPKILLVIV